MTDKYLCYTRATEVKSFTHLIAFINESIFSTILTSQDPVNKQIG
jgi:hypothetical protein